MLVLDFIPEANVSSIFLNNLELARACPVTRTNAICIENASSDQNPSTQYPITPKKEALVKINAPPKTKNVNNAQNINGSGSHLSITRTHIEVNLLKIPFFSFTLSINFPFFIKIEFQILFIYFNLFITLCQL